MFSYFQMENEFKIYVVMYDMFGKNFVKHFVARYDMFGDDEESGGKSKQGRNYQSWQ